VRELENRIAAYVLLGLEETPEEIAALRQHLATKSAIQQDGVIPLKQVAEKACREVGREAILQALQANRWNRRRAAEDLKISYRALLYKIREAGVPPKQSNRQILGAGGTPTSSAE
jgi:two-component system response regulator AtoC